MSEPNDFGGSGITEALYAYVRGAIPAGKRIVELGSGKVSTRKFGECYEMFSVEDQAAYIGQYNSTYIHAPLVKYRYGEWYDIEVLKAQLPEKYDLLLIDGPVGCETSRLGFMLNIDLFNTNVPMVFDDTWRPVELLQANMVSAVVRRALILFSSFAVIPL